LVTRIQKRIFLFIAAFICFANVAESAPWKPWYYQCKFEPMVGKVEGGGRGVFHWSWVDLAGWNAKEVVAVGACVDSRAYYFCGAAQDRHGDDLACDRNTIGQLIVLW
jgi:hypothetical protein